MMYENIGDFIINAGLYENYEITPINKQATIDYFEGIEVEDSFCVNCKKTSTFQKEYLPYENPLVEIFKTNMIDFFIMKYECTRCNKNTIACTLLLTPSFISKIGMFPSLAALQEKDIKKYARYLNKKIENQLGLELTKATGLHSHGIGIGSFVYLRRIIEKLVFKAYEEEKQSWSPKQIEDFEKNRFADKVKLLKNQFPSDVVELLAPCYSLLSEGVHQLSEEECKNKFDLLYNAIIIILDELIQKEERVEKLEQAKKALLAEKNKNQ